jgi:hypothetical protein
MQKWEYYVYQPRYDRTAGTLETTQHQQWLNRLGEEGWELVSAYSDGLVATYVLKRPKK